LTDDTKHAIITFLGELLHPEGYGHAVTLEVRQHARLILNMIESESINEQDSTIRQTV
jgi:hypothetical protein